MKYHLLDILACPECHNNLTPINLHEINGDIESGQLICQDCGQQYPIIASIPRFVPVQNYADNFGWQWNKFRQTQLDSYSGLSISRERFFRQTNWTPADLAGKTVLDVGCGAGRFSEIALSCKANVVALDYSAAVDACWQNLGSQQGLSVVQGNIYHLPFKPASFDFVYCFGVLQHTPDVHQAFLALPEQLRGGGRLAVDVYPKLLSNVLWPKYWLRPVTKRISSKRLFSLIQLTIKLLLPVSIWVGRIPLVGRKLRYAIPVANYEGIYPLSKTQLREWGILDTFDMLAPAYDQPQTASTLEAWLIEAGLKGVRVFRSGLLIGQGVK